MNEEELKRLLEKYYNGTSTDEDEKTLRAWFTENIAPEGYEAEKEIFSYYVEDGKAHEPSDGFEARIIKAIDDSDRVSLKAKARKLFLPALSAAAGLLILAGSYFFFVHSPGNGDTFTDPEIAYAETMKILMDVSSQMNQGTRSLKTVGRINEMKTKSFESINKSAVLVEKNLRNLEYLRSADEKPADSEIR
jgi:hypothetical protein